MSICVQCGAAFNCGMVDNPSAEPCWCVALPPLPAELLASAGDASRCFCPVCLTALVRQHFGD